LSDVTKDNERIIANAKEKYKQDLLSGQLKYKNGPEYIYEEELKARATVLYLEPYDNPWFEGSSLELQMLRDKESFFELYETKWLGKPLQHNNAQIFKNKWEASVFEAPENAIFCFGADWGNTDPTVLTRCYILGDSKDQYEQILYIDYSVRIENASLNEIATLWNTVPNVPKKNTGTNKKIFADSNWPQSTQEMSSKYNFSVCSVDKWSNSVKQGIMYLKSFKKIIIHERCKDLIDEFKLYSYKVDARSGEITDDIVGKYDHGIDSIRYALSPYIKKGKSSYFDLVQHVLNQQH
jgi:phage terminase large subunit